MLVSRPRPGLETVQIFNGLGLGLGLGSGGLDLGHAFRYSEGGHRCQQIIKLLK